MRFKNTWLRQRHDLKDQSQSGYDMALAMFGAEYSLAEQAIVDLIVTHRTLHHQKQRKSLDYYQRTISKAFNGSTARPAPLAARWLFRISRVPRAGNNSGRTRRPAEPRSSIRSTHSG